MSLAQSQDIKFWLSFSTCFAPPLFFIIGEFSLLIISLFSPFLSLQNYFDYRDNLFVGGDCRKTLTDLLFLNADC